MGTAMSWVDNIGVRLKVALAPIIMGLLLLVMVGYGSLTMTGNIAQLRQLEDTNARFDVIHEFLLETAQARGDLYRLISVAANDNDPTHLDERASAVMGTLRTLDDQTETVRAAALAVGLDPTVAEDASKHMKAFLKSALDAADMVQADVATALTFMGATERYYQAGRTTLEAMRAQVGTLAAEKREALRDTLSRARTLFLGLGTLSLVLGMAVAVGLSVRIAGPIRALTATLQRLSEREYTVEVPGRDREDETGVMARALFVLRESLKDGERLAAERDAAQKTRQQRGDHLDTLTRHFGATVSEVLGALEQASATLTTTARDMAAMADAANSQSATVAAAAEETSATVEGIAGAAEQMTASIRSIGTEVERSTSMASQAVTEAERTDATVRGLAEAAQKIGAVVDLITTIASQTNLLALNATIEAARAGDAGKGFAVVAGEVKHLAGQTARATEDIATQVTTIQSVTGAVVEAIGAIGTTISQINNITGLIADAVHQQGEATTEISNGVQHAATGSRDVSATITQVTQTAAHTEKAADAVLEAAGALSHQTTVLRTEVDRFLAAIKEA
ncbi:methyl-accepting chemotaxis protein [Pararhodospirillum oryzae]|uniref:Methyl-accepting chemotaxis protein n=1 Tax=Pararhodospirillum oryzae TaxID=478448 RepID=A0A512HAI4_9PROT|nr:methyl-accepting chemotaxis protein [Pararhodospirillum oryzae]GEO82452.1 hypothetical protein ROR02_25830 [Pararhodospirillum oryzae]